MTLSSCRSLMWQKYFSNELQLQKYVLTWVQVYSMWVYSGGVYSGLTYFPTACWPGRDLDKTQTCSIPACPALLGLHCGKIWRIWPLTAPPLSPSFLASQTRDPSRDLNAVAQDIFLVSFYKKYIFKIGWSNLCSEWHNGYKHCRSALLICPTSQLREHIES